MMKLCFSTIGCPDWRFADIVSAAKDLGYSAIEIRGIEGEIYAPAIKELTDDFPRTKELLDRTGIKIAMLTSGAALAAAVRLLRMPENAEKTLVALLPDSGDRYFSTPIFE